MVTGHPDYAYALDFLKRLNTVSYQGVPLQNSFFYEGYNLWHSFQQLLFEDIKRYSKTRTYTAVPPLTFLGAVRYMISGIFMGVLSVAAVFKLRLFRTPVLIYTIDRDTSPYHSDFRLSELYRFLHEKNINYIECLHTVPGRAMYKSAFTRRRTTLYFEFFDFLFWLKSVFSGKGNDEISISGLDLSVFTDDERLFAHHLVVAYAKRAALSRFKIEWLRRMLFCSRFKAVFAIDDVRYYSELLLAARYAGIKTFALQHGHFTRYHVGWLWNPAFKGKAISPDSFLVWSTYWKHELIRLGTHFPPASIVVGGVKDSYGKIKDDTSRAQSTDKMTVLVPYETACPKLEVTEYIKSMLACKNVQVVFKLRPDKPAEEQLAEYGLFDERAQLIVTTDAAEVIDKVHVVVGVYSTYLYDMVAQGKSVGILNTSSDYGAGMKYNGLADVIGRENLCADLKKLATLQTSELDRRRTKLLGDRPVLLRNTLSDIARNLSLCSA
jgi:hypothetical protein